MNSHVTLPIDTCIFLHFKAFTQIKWKQVANADRVVLAVCLQVIDDLDKFTHDARLADRARRSLKDIEESQNKEFQEGVTLIILDGLRHQDFPSEMDPEVTDNHVIRSAQVYQEDHPQETVMIVTEDTGMTLRAKKAGVQCLRLPDSERLPNVDDELTRRWKKAEAELAEERTKRPNLELTVTPADGVDEPDSDEFFSPGVFHLVNVDEAMRKVRAMYPKTVSDRHANPGQYALPLDLFSTASQTAEHNERLDKYYQSYERYLQARNSWLQKRGSFFSFDVSLTNKGKALATYIKIVIAFPPFIRFFDPKVCLDPPDSFPIRPPIPRKRSSLGIFGHESLIAPLASIPARFADEERIPRILLRNETRPTVEVTLGKLIHGNMPTNLRTITFWFLVGEQPRKFAADCSILSAELPKSLQQTLVVEIQRP